MGKKLLLICAILFFSILMQPLLFAQCPEVKNDETDLDCPWAEIARELESAQLKKKSLEEIFKLRIPVLWKALANYPNEVKDLWGESLNFDENVKKEIVDDSILKSISLRFGYNKSCFNQSPASCPVHAGLTHTYGYLFSTLKTEFGFKRARWVSPEIAQGFNLSSKVLSPEPIDGDFLSNVTYFASKIALKHEFRVEDVLKKNLEQNVSSELVGFDYKKLKKVRLVEQIQMSDRRIVELRTDLIEFFKQSKNSYLLIYSIKDSKQKHSQLITLFPVNRVFFDSVLDKKYLGQRQPIRTRYNAFVNGLTGKNEKGYRYIEN